MLRKQLTTAIRTILILAFIFSGIIFGLTTISSKENIKYVTIKPKTGRIEISVITAGEIIASDLVLVGAQVSGQIKQMHTTLGQYVRKGDLIAEIDSAPQLNTLYTTKALLQMQKAQLLVKQIIAREAMQKLKRRNQLIQKEVLSREDLETFENALDLAEGQVQEVLALIKKTQIELDKAKTDLAYTKILAPIDGTIVSIPVKAGQTVNASQIAPTIVQLADLKKLELRMMISEGDVTKVHPGMLVKFSILSDQKKSYVGPLISIEPGPVHLSNNKDDVKVQEKEPIYYYGRVKINNDNSTFYLGMTTQCKIVSQSVAEAIIIPCDAVRTNGDKAYVLTQGENGSLKLKEVSTGLQDDINIEVISGITIEDKIVLSQIDGNEIESKINALF